MGLIQDWLSSRKEKKEEKNNYERQQGIMENYEKKKISNDERELIKHYEAERQKKISEKLKEIQAEKTHKFWSGHQNNPIDAPNIISHSPNVIKSKSNLFLGGKI